VSPDATHFHEGTKLRPFQFINEVIDFVRAAHELRLGSVDCDLYFAIDCIVEFGVNQDVVGALLKSVFDSNDFELVRHFITHLLQLLKNL
jgi:hypothetical protein